ncbi:MAG: hypothetical protein FJ096_09985 [Deltaproteobacteria bacterium]|nr:hypothetical protein [Deltaproteobacteria bacterium]
MTTHSRSSTPALVFALAAALGLTMTAPRAEACGGGWWPEVQAIDYRVQGIASAEKDLAEGRHLAAAGKVIRMIPHIRAYSKASSDLIVNRSLRVLAVASARSGGDLSKLADELPSDLKESFAGMSDEARTENLRWSVKALKALRKSKKDDVTLKTELAEAMAALPETKAKARKTLEKLARKDLITTPEAYRALGRLRAEAGNTDGEAHALERCRTMARDAAICDGQAAAPGES